VNSNLDRNRVDPAEFSPTDRASLERLNTVLIGVHGKHHSLCLSTDGENRVDLPEPLFKLLKQVARSLKEGKPIVLIPETESLTTQAAANFLGMSRPFLIQLLNEGKIQFHRVGTHRRIYLKDLNEFMRNRDASRHEALDRLNDEIEKAGLYEAGTLNDAG
jgi:excisionase family DNA binding protein